MELVGAPIPLLDENVITLQKQQNKQTTEQEEGGEKNLIIVTGFGPFKGHESVNASWEAVRLLPDILEHNNCNYIVNKQLIATEYAAVDKIIPQIWSQKPKLVIHCGVSGDAECIYVETNACNNNFRKADAAGNTLPNCKAILCKDSEQCVRLECGLNVSEIVNKTACHCILTKTGLNHIEKPQQIVKISHNTGDYLCAYIYLKSLDINAKRTLFVHVPCIDKPFNSAQTADVILKIIQCCLEQINDSQN